MSVLHGTGLEITNIDIKSNRQWSTLLFASRSVPLGSGLSSWIPTASAVRYYTEMQSCLAAAVFPSILSGNSALLLLSLCNGGSIRIDTQHSLDLRDLVNRLYGLNSCSDRISLSMSTRCSLFDLLVWSSGAIDRRLQHSCVIFFFCCCCSLSSIVSLYSAYRSIGLIQYDVGKASNTKCYIELMSSSSCFGLARLLCSEAFDFTQ